MYYLAKQNGEKYIDNLEWSLVEFIYYFLTDLNTDYLTFNSDNNEIQCYRGKHRSLGDIFNICVTYYPDTTIEEVKEILLDFGEDLVGHYCGDIRKRVYELTSRFRGWEQCGADRNDEYDIPIEYREENIHKIKYPNLFKEEVHG